MALEELQVSINGPTEGFAMGLSRTEVVEFNASTNCVSDFVLRHLSPYPIGKFEKIVIAGKSAGAVEFDQIGEVLIAKVELDWAAYYTARSKKLFLFDLTRAVLEDCAATFGWGSEPVFALEKLRVAAQGPYVYQISADVQSPDRKRTAALFFEYGELQIRLFAVVKEVASMQSKNSDVWLGERGKTYWSSFCGYLGKLQWRDNSHLQLIPKKKSLRGETSSVVV
jgi:hypothetical protein